MLLGPQIAVFIIALVLHWQAIVSLSCYDGFRYDDTLTPACAKCASDTYAISGDSSCTACPANSWSVEGAGSCQCNSGYGQSGSGSSLSCNICPATFYSAATTCPQGYTYCAPTDSCYKVILVEADYSTAAKNCNDDKRGYLVTINSELENAYVSNLSGGAICDVWIGYSDIISEGSMVWQHGTSSFTRWNVKQPDNYTDLEDCVHISAHTGSIWNVKDCKEVSCYVCEADPLADCYSVRNREEPPQSYSSITFSSCFYIIESKFNADTYVAWMNNLISIVNNFNLVIYTDEKSAPLINIGGNSRIKIVIKPFEDFLGYQLKDFWIANHEKNTLLNKQSSWQLNMLWSEKIAFVYETADKKYFETEFYGWCDIGYFRNRSIDTPVESLVSWPSAEKIAHLDRTKIHYACVIDDQQVLDFLFDLINDKNHLGLPVNEIPPDQTSIGGGLFVAHKTKIEWWRNTYYHKLVAYVRDQRLVKDDQTILVDCIFSDLTSFALYGESPNGFDGWFMFQRIFGETVQY